MNKLDMVTIPSSQIWVLGINYSRIPPCSWKQLPLLQSPYINDNYNHISMMENSTRKWFLYYNSPTSCHIFPNHNLTPIKTWPTKDEHVTMPSTSVELRCPWLWIRLPAPRAAARRTSRIFGGRKPKQPPDMYETLKIMGFLPYWLARYFSINSMSVSENQIKF